ncbi:MAG TPA: hypothetical protein VLC28_01650, partial [Flavitalea sp.]|nr:hypothetical protein [Flavitalea sp.]
MKQIIKIASFLIALVQLSCGKGPIVTQPQSETSNYIRIEVKELPGIDTILKGSYVMLSVINDENDEIVKNRKLALTYESSYRTEKLLLPAGKYRIAGLLVRNTRDSLMYAAPYANSIRASEVQRTLYTSFSLPSTNDLIVPAEVARVRDGDQPSLFGYPTGSFGDQPQKPGDETILARVRLNLTIGDILYDSIPSMLKITVWDKQNQVNSIYKPLAPGTNAVLLPRLANKYSLQIEKWGYAEEKLIDPSSVDANSLYEFKGVLESRKLLSEITYRVVDGVDKPETKTLYLYNPDRTIHQTIHYKKKSDGSPYIAFTDNYAYNNDHLESIRRYESANEIESTLFIRNAEGLPQAITHTTSQGITTNALVSYYTAEGGKGIHVNYKYSHHSNTLDYNIRMSQGNMSESAATRANTTSEI